MRLVLILLFFAVSFSFAQGKKAKKRSAKNKKSNQRVELEVPVNVGVGPAVYITPWGGVYLGAEIELYAAVSPDLVKANIDKVPKRFRRMAKGINDEVQIRPFPLPLIPQSLIISPRDALGSQMGYAYGAIWQPLFGIQFLGFGNYQSPVSFNLGVGLPSVFYLTAEHPELDNNSQHIYGVGADANSRLTFRMSPKLAIQFKAVAQANYSNKYSIKEDDGWKTQQFIPLYRASATLNYRFGYKTKL